MQGNDLQDLTTLVLAPPGVMSDLVMVMDTTPTGSATTSMRPRRRPQDAATQERLLGSARDARDPAATEALGTLDAAKREADRRRGSKTNGRRHVHRTYCYRLRRPRMGLLKKKPKDRPTPAPKTAPAPERLKAVPDPEAAGKADAPAGRSEGSRYPTELRLAETAASGEANGESTSGDPDAYGLRAELLRRRPSDDEPGATAEPEPPADEPEPPADEPEPPADEPEPLAADRVEPEDAVPAETPEADAEPVDDQEPGGDPEPAEDAAEPDRDERRNAEEPALESAESFRDADETRPSTLGPRDLRPEKNALPAAKPALVWKRWSDRWSRRRTSCATVPTGSPAARRS